MNAISPICLTDLAPALRWSNPADVSPVLRHARLVDGWWRSLPLARVLDIAGPTWLAHCLARLSTEHWPYLELGDFLPTLRECPLDVDDIAEPVRSAVLATAGGWDQLVSSTPETMAGWFPHGECGITDVVSTAAWQALQPFTGDAVRTPAPSPALVIEAVRAVTHWIPASAPEHVHNALSYLATATGADCAAGPGGAQEAPQTPASRAIRTLRALRAQRSEEESGGSDDQQPAPATAASLSGKLAKRRNALLGRDGSRRPSFNPTKNAAAPGPTCAQGAPELGTHPLVDLLEDLFRGWDELERTVAAERLFAADPVSIRLLADQVHVEIAEIRNAQRSVEERLLQWLGSSAGAPVTKHLRDLSDRLGTATTIDHLISAHPDHPAEVPTLRTPLWRVVITLFTDRRLHNGWLVTEDPQRLRWQTREMLGDAPSLTEAGIRLGRLGIRQQSLRAWLLSTPGVSIRDGQVLVDPATPIEPPPQAAGGGHAGMHQAADGSTTTNGLPIRRRPAPGQRQTAPAPAAADTQASLPGVETSARCFRAPDGRWWHRVDVTADHLNGAPVTVPPGYATHLGLRPGRLLCLTAPGADLLVLVWRDQPAFDSLRPLLRRLSAQPGDRVFMTVNGDRLDARRLPADTLGDHTPTSRALHLIGYTAPATTEEAMKIIAHRISPEGEEVPAEPQALLERLAKRGDDDIVSELGPGLYAVNH
ncbi:hypothetical protein HNR23_001229 [Nocardiopsis mwathae]|uniref:Uncharacterized protein n=1 Tax=Nocardiopsis mwathae TaxID=1472723 RepID=A0A7X0D5I9_9ACTN|nr:hypothetical protein [Nocardiopsis mwathae]MBB6171169.1 hypothetical protein [Nocardiopsis mwathae]